MIFVVVFSLVVLFLTISLYYPILGYLDITTYVILIVVLIEILIVKTVYQLKVIEGFSRRAYLSASRLLDAIVDMQVTYNDQLMTVASYNVKDVYPTDSKEYDITDDRRKYHRYTKGNFTEDDERYGC